MRQMGVEMEKRNPCLKCEDRTEECHAKCMKYDSWKKAHEAYRKMIDRERNPEIKQYIDERHWE